MSDPTQTTSWTLIHEASVGADAAREAFVRRYQPAIETALRMRWRTGAARGEIEDAAQEVLFDCLRDGGALGRADPERAGGFRPYLRGIVRTVALRWEARRHRHREQGVATGHWELEADPRAGDIERAFDRAWAEDLVREAADRLRAWADTRGAAARRRVEILELRFAEGLPTRRIAEQLGLPAKQVQKQYALARAEYEAMLRQVVAVHDPGSEEQVAAECRALLAILGPE